MNLFTNLRISQRIMLLVAGLAMGFVLIGVTYYWQILLDSKVNTKHQSIVEQQNIVSQLQIKIMEINSLLIAPGENVDKLKESVNDLGLLYQQLKSNASDFHELIQERQQIEVQLASIKALFERSVLIGQEYKVGNSTHSEKLRTAIGTIKYNSSVTDQYIRLRESESRFFSNFNLESMRILQKEARVLQTRVDNLNDGGADVTALQKSISSYLSWLDSVANQVTSAFEANTEFMRSVGQLILNLETQAKKLESLSKNMLSEIEIQTQTSTVVFIGLVFTIAIGVALGVYFIYKSIVFPMTHMQSVIRRINRGNLRARVKLLQEDELGDLGKAFNLLLDERIHTLEEQAQENEALNNSIIELITALGEIAKKNLTVKVPVQADITGTISDAVNLLTSETASTLAQVQDISNEVKAVSDMLQNQSSTVVKVAEDERKLVIATSRALDASAKEVNQIAEKARSADNIAAKTINETKDARDAVMQTVNGILTIRESISETEKRMKRLGERSQEISGIVNLINTIAERTHILALNASMHAASAGEAGKGFAVVADEVQRLAENAREATAEISSMVNNIRVETADTVNTMNKLISEVAHGTRLAEQADKNMQMTEDATRELVETVQVISKNSVHQAEISNTLRDRANIIRKFTEKTGSLLVQQKQHTDSLKNCASVLMDRINVFDLPLRDSSIEPEENLPTDVIDDSVSKAS